MKIVHVIKAIGIAGAESHLLTLLPGLQQAGIDVSLLLLHPPDNPLDEFVERLGSVPVIRLTMARHIAPLWKMRQYLREQQPDIVHTHLIHADLYGTLAARLARVPRVVTSRHNDNPFRKRRPIRLLNHLLWRNINGGIAISEAVRQFCQQVEGAPADKIETIHYGFPPIETSSGSIREELGLRPQVPLFGSVCRLIPQKGLQYALDAFAQVHQHFPDAHYVIAGDGLLRQELEIQAQQLKLADVVHFLGWRDNVHAVMASLDVFVAPSLWEGFGLVFLEAMNHRLPIISTFVSAIPEIVVDNETGYLVPPADSEALARATIKLLDDPDLRQRMGQAGYDRLRAVFTVEQMVSATLAFYNEVYGE